MKKIINIAFLLLSINFYAQGNLQFNRVITLTVSGSVNDGNFLPGAEGTNLGTINIPAGKVWKIEAVTAHLRSGPGLAWPFAISTSSESLDFILISDFVVWQPTSQLGLRASRFPLWLDDGNHEVMAKNQDNINIIIAISAIEFNIIP